MAVKPVPFLSRFDSTSPVIGMIHVGPSPGLPDSHPIKEQVERATEEARIYLKHGVDGLLVENMYDFPCVHEREMGPEVASFMTRLCSAVTSVARDIPVGVQILFQANITAVAVAFASGCSFIRAEGWTHAHISDKGIAKATGGKVYRYRHTIGADDVAILADVKKKHASHAWTADLTAENIASGFRLHHADGIVVTGEMTGSPPDLNQIRGIRNASDLPLLVGSGITSGNISDYFPYVDGFIVGSSLKKRGSWDEIVSESNVAELMERATACRMKT